MTYRPLIDVAVNPELLPPLTPGFIDLELAKAVALQGLQACGASPENLLKTFSGLNPTWYLPPRYLKVGRKRLGPKVELRDKAIKTLLQVHNTYREIVASSGMCDVVRRELREYFLGGVTSPLIFTECGPGRESADLFSLELIIQLEVPKSYVTLNGESLVRHFPGKRAVYSKIYLSNYSSSRVTKDWLESTLASYRGTALFPTYDIFDRCLDWARAAGCGVHIEASLSWLKLHQSKELAYDFEQAIYKLEPAEPEEVVLHKPKEVIHTHEALNEAKDLWFSEDLEPYDAFRQFKQYLVPRLMDEEEFFRMFKKALVPRQEFSEQVQNEVDSKMYSLELFFIRRMKEH